MVNLTRVEKLRTAPRGSSISGKPMPVRYSQTAVVEEIVETTPPEPFWSGWSALPSYTSVPPNGSGVTWTLSSNAIDISPRDALLSFTGAHQFRGGSIDASNCTSLVNLQLSNSFLLNLDVSNCPSLHTILAGGNKLSAVDFSGCSSLNFVVLLNNKLSSIDLNGLTNLGYLDVMANSLTSLDLTGLTGLSGIVCGNNKIKGNLTGLSSISTANGGKTVWIRDNEMTAEHIDNVYSQLPNKGSASGSWSVLIGGNPGVGSQNDSIATAKGWNVAI